MIGLREGHLLTIFLATVLAGSGFSTHQVSYAQEAGVKDPEFTFQLDVIQHPSMKIGEKQNWMRKGVDFLLERAVTIMATTIGGAAVLMMAVGGFMMMFGGIKEDRYNKGKSMIINAAIGLVFVLSAYILVTTVQLLIKSILG